MVQNKSLTAKGIPGNKDSKLGLMSKFFDFVIGFSSIYKYNLQDVIKTIIEINRVSKKAFFTVAAYSNKTEREIFEDWTLLGTTILHKKEWLTLFKLLNYKGDYYFTTSNSLNLK